MSDTNFNQAYFAFMALPKSARMKEALGAAITDLCKGIAADERLAEKVSFRSAVVDELVQSMAAKVWAKIGNYEPNHESMPATYFYRVALNEAVNIIRKKGADGHGVAYADQREDGGGIPPVSDPPHDPGAAEDLREAVASADPFKMTPFQYLTYVRRMIRNLLIILTQTDNARAFLSRHFPSYARNLSDAGMTRREVVSLCELFPEECVGVVELVVGGMEFRDGPDSEARDAEVRRILAEERWQMERVVGGGRSVPKYAMEAWDALVSEGRVMESSLVSRFGGGLSNPQRALWENLRRIATSRGIKVNRDTVGDDKVLSVMGG